MSRPLPILCGAFLFAGSMHAGIIVYDSTGQASNGADSLTQGALYDSFSTGANSGTLSELVLLLDGDQTSAGSIAVGLYADSSISPGALMTTLGTINDSSLTAGLSLVTVTLGTQPALSTGTRYWIGLVGTSSTGHWSYTFDTSGIGVNGEFASNFTGTFPNNPDGGYQMEVELTAATPEPSTLILGAGALAILAAFLRRRPSAVAAAAPAQHS